MDTIDLNGETWHSLACNIVESRLTTGNDYLEIIESIIAGERLDRLVLHQATDCLYAISEDNEVNRIAISCNWSENYLRRYPPKSIPVFPFYAEFESDGTNRTIIHEKDGNYKWYGRPKVLSALADMYNEHQSRVYISKQLKKGFIPQLILEVEAEENTKFSPLNNHQDAQDGFQNTAHRLEQNYTNEGDDPTTVLFMERPYGAKAFTAKEISGNSNENYFDKILSISRCNIVMAHDWSEALLRKDKTSGFNSQMFMDVFKIESATKILEVQEMVGSILNKAIKAIAKRRGLTQFENLSIKFKSPIQKLVEQMVEMPDGSNNIDTDIQDGNDTTDRDIMTQLNSYGIGVRSGAITPQKIDEEYFRNQIGLPIIEDAVDQAWEEDEGFRRPVTLKDRAVQEREELDLENNESNNSDAGN